MDEKKPSERVLINKAVALKNACFDTLYCEDCVFYAVKEDACNINRPSEWTISGTYKTEA